MRGKLIAVAGGIIALFVIFFVFLPDGGVKEVAFVFAALAAVAYLLAIRRELRRNGQRWRKSLSAYTLSAFWILFLLLPVLYLIFILGLTSLTLGTLFYFVALMGLTFTLFYDFVNLPLAVYHKRMERKRLARETEEQPLFTFIVPAYNEERVIARTLASLLEVDYPRYEILVVDDGSVDRTAEVARRFAPRGVQVIQRPNGGKSAALNLGLFFARGDIVVSVDADSLVARDCLKELVKLFADPKVMAVAGNVKVLNRMTFLGRLQALEYIRDINITRRAFDVFGTTMIVPGVLGAFRRSALRDVGDYDPDTVTEDFDTTMKVLKSGSAVQATSYAEAYTEAPESLGDLYRQRHRWYAGIFQTLVKHGDALRNPRRFGFLSGIGYPYVLLSAIFVPLVGLIALISGVLASFTGEAFSFLQILGFFIVLEVLISLMALIMDGEDLKLAVLAPLFVVGYRQLRDVIRMKALFDVLLRRKVGWSRAARLGRADEMLVLEG